MNDLDTNKLWREVLESIKVSVSPAIYSTWFSDTFLLSLNQNNNRYLVEVGCKSSFVKTTIETRYYGLIQDTLIKSLNSPCDLTFIIKEPDESGGLKPLNSVPLFSRPASDEPLLNDYFTKSGIRSFYTFDNFAVSTSNQMAWAAAEAVSNSPGSAYNPLFIWGGVGVGKTHLMNAVGYYLMHKDRDCKICTCTGEQFTNDIVEGIRNKSTQNVRNKYRKLNALFLDDVQFIAGKDAVQEEFFHTFNALVSIGAQIILTSDKPPSEISKLEERLRSRFEAGLIVDIAPPDFELRCAITQIKAKEKAMDIPMDIIQIIAGNIESARKIEGFLVKLSSELKIKNIKLTPELVESLLQKGTVQNGLTTKKNPDEVIDLVCKYFSIGKRIMLGKVRTRSIARPRQILMYLLRTQMLLPFDEVGRIIGGRDHTTVMHAVDKITHLASTDVQIRENIQGIKNAI